VIYDLQLIKSELTYSTVVSYTDILLQ